MNSLHVQQNIITFLIAWKNNRHGQKHLQYRYILSFRWDYNNESFDIYIPHVYFEITVITEKQRKDLKQQLLNGGNSTHTPKTSKIVGNGFSQETYCKAKNSQSI